LTTKQRIYLDVCCLNRPFDDQSQERIRLESEAIILIISRLQSGDWVWLGSDAIDYEVDQTPDPERQRRVRVLATAIQHSVPFTQAETARAQELQSFGFKQWDALHLACAESGQADIFLTTDDKLLRLAHQVAVQLKVQVENPLTWLTEVTE
jgi:hypothetical protein